MKKFLTSAFLIFVISCNLISAQDSTYVVPESSPLIYTFGYNRIPENCNLPLIGVVNKTQGSHAGIEIGVLNHCRNNFSGLQIGFANLASNNLAGSQIGFLNTTGNNSTGFITGFINATGNSANGCQIGFVNAVGDKFRGLEVGFVNATGDKVYGFQTGFINATGDKVNGIQAGFINATGDQMNGVQLGFANFTGDKVHGFQTGFLNFTGDKFRGIELGFLNFTGNKFTGIQIGFCNKVHTLSGFQLGFLNFTDTVEHGIPLGFLTYVKHGGYQAVDVSISELFPVNISYKTGTEILYTSINASFGADTGHQFAFGLGLGSFIHLSPKLAFNPEYVSQTTLFQSWEQLQSLKLNFNYQFDRHFSVFAGPSVTWQHLNSTTYDWFNPFLSVFTVDVNAGNKIYSGLNAGVRYRF